MSFITLKKIRNFIPLLILGLASFVFTAFVLLNAYEQVFFRDIPYFETLRVYQHSEELTKIVSRMDSSSDFLHRVVTDTPRYLTIPSINSSIELTPMLYRDSFYYVRGNKGHVIKKAKSNTMAIYLDENWRTTTDLGNLKVNDVIFILSYDYNYIFKIEEVLVNATSAFAPKEEDSQTPKIVIVGEKKDTLIVATAVLVNSVFR
jgi:hypothetical protein